MNAIQSKLREIQSRKRVGIMTHVVVGYPTLDATERLITTMASGGADFIELQIPFSDPLADGPTIMRACEESLARGTRVSDAFEIARRASVAVTTPLLFMAYYNTVFCYGVERFCKDAKSAGVSGLIVPDMAIDEEVEEHYLHFCSTYDLQNIQVVSPASTIERHKMNAKIAKGFIYCTAQQGTTGARNELDPQVVSFLERVRQEFDIPLAVGFGISKREHVDLLSPHADIVVIGSAIIEVVRNAKKGEIVHDVKRFLNLII